MWILKYLPDWIFYLILLIGVLGLIISRFIPLYYRTAAQALCASFIVIGVFMSGAIYDYHSWQDQVIELKTKLAEAELKSAESNTKIVEKVITKTEHYREKGKDIIQYVDREIVKYDSRCEIPKEFIEAHNKAASK